MNQHFLDLIAQTRVLQYPPLNQPPASIQDIELLQERARAELAGYSPPAFYLNFLRVVDGMDRNGHQLYGSKTRKTAGFEALAGYEIMGLVEANLLWRDYPPNQQFVFLVETGDLLYCHNLTSGKFEVVDRITKEMDDDETDAYDTPAPMFERLFHKMLNHHEVADDES